MSAVPTPEWLLEWCDRNFPHMEIVSCRESGKVFSFKWRPRPGASTDASSGERSSDKPERTRAEQLSLL